jgi:hypothetical protein
MDFDGEDIATNFPPKKIMNCIKSLQDLTVLPTEFFRRRKTHIPSVINLPTESPTKMLRR